MGIVTRLDYLLQVKCAGQQTKVFNPSDWLQQIYETRAVTN